jgi:hypothetical protein
LETLKKLTYLRYLGNALLIIGHIFLLHMDIRVGVVLKTLAFSLTLPYFIQARLWDVVLLSLLFSSIELTKLIALS